MSHENMYVAEKELCKGTLIELERLNDVKGIGRQRKKERKQQAQPQETVLEFRNGVMARVTVAPSGSSSSGSGPGMSNSGYDPMQPFIAEGGELLAGLSEEQRNAILLGDPNVTANDFSRPLIEAAAPAEPAPKSSLRAPAPSWARRRKGVGRERQQQAQLMAAAEAETDDEADDDGLPHQLQHQRLPGKRKDREERSKLSFTMGEDDEPE